MTTTSCSSCGATLRRGANSCPGCGAAQSSGGGFSLFQGAGGGLLGALETIAGAVLKEVIETEFNTVLHPNGTPRVVGALQRDPHDPNDVHYDVHTGTDPASLPGFVDLRDHLTPVEDQGELGSCTANAIAGAFEYLEKRTTGNEGRVSRLFVYYNERKMEGNESKDSGASLRNGMKVLQQYGACSEDTWPYDVSTFKNEPHAQAYDEAAAHTVDEYQRVPLDLHAMKTCLSEGYPFVFGTKIYESFERHGTHGHVEMPARGEKDLGGHAMLCCGFSDQDQVFVVRNSWGPKWGDKGYCYFPYAYLTDARLTHDLWTVRRAHNLDFTQRAEPGESSHESGRLSFFSDAAEGVADIAGDSLETPADEVEAPGETIVFGNDETEAPEAEPLVDESAGDEVADADAVEAADADVLDADDDATDADDTAEDAETEDEEQPA